MISNRSKQDFNINNLTLNKLIAIKFKVIL